MHVLIAGAGIGGLALAQRLRRAGIAATVLERDPSVDARAQGYRININPDGGRALAACLPADLYATFRATSNRPDGGRVVTYDHRFTPLHTRTAPPHPYTAVNRLTLREVLLTGLRPRYASPVTGYATGPHGVRAHLADGTEMAGDLLVAADGTGSSLRRALLPDAGWIPAGVHCVWGRTPLSALPTPDPAWSNRVSSFLGPDGHVLVTGSWIPRIPPDQAAAHLTPQAPYVMWALMTTAPPPGRPRAHARTEGARPSGTHACSRAEGALLRGSSGDPRAHARTEDVPLPTTPDGLHAYARAVVDGWDPRLRALVARGGGCFAVPIRAARPVPPWVPGRVTVLGDAIHTMTPAGGTGANTALRDAALLGGLLERGGPDPVPAVAAYEVRMRAYGFAAVARSLEPEEVSS